MPKPTNVIKLYASKEGTQKTRSKRILEISDDSESNDHIAEHPKKILKKVIGGDTKIITNDNMISKMFTYEECDVLVIRDENRDYWYKGKDIATILEYGNTNDAILRLVDKDYKKSFADMGSGFPSPVYVDSQTIFIDDTGLMQLVSRSNKPEAIKLWRQITKEILPTLFRTGYYEMPITEKDADRLNQSFYDDNMLSKFMKDPCIYLAYIGKHKVVINGIKKLIDVIKYGNTINIAKRDLEQHRKNYDTFNVLGIWKTLAHIKAEQSIKQNFESLNMIVKINIKGSNKREHIVLTERHNLDYCLNMIQQVITETSTPLEEEYKTKIKDLESQITLLTQKNKYLIRLNRQLKDNLIDLRKKM